jgi:PTH1 family peptidyl-tRNA hydrolase
MKYRGLIAGLGNPGPEYENTRHNIGFMLVDSILAEIASKHYRKSSEVTTRADARLWAVTLPRVRGEVLLAKPLTYMNRSGQALAVICREQGIRAKELLVAHDDLDLAPGRIKIKAGGGNAGHNGLESITMNLGTPDFLRLRLGIGHPGSRDAVTGYVLSGFGPDEGTLIADMLAMAREALPVLYNNGLASTQQKLHAFRPAP